MKRFALIASLCGLALTATAQTEPGVRPDLPGALAKALATRAGWAGANYPAADLRLSSAYADAGGLEHVYVQQLHRGIPVYNQVQSLAFVGPRLVAHQGHFVPARQLAGLPGAPGLSAAQAVALALRHLGVAAPMALARRESGVPTADGPEARQAFAGTGVARRDIVASLMWALDDTQHAHLVWNVNLDLLGSPDWWNVRLDAGNGAVIGQDNQTTYEVATSRTRPADRPAAAAAAVACARPAMLPPPPPTTTTSAYLVVPYPQAQPAATGLLPDTDPWLKAGAGNPATTHGWHFDGTTNHALTSGNNVAAYDDAAGRNMPGNYAPSLTAAPGLSFAYPANFATSPTTVANRNASVTNLFYWVNIAHDLTYQYGFTEAAGNFQVSNLGRGGAGGDAVQAEAQDGSNAGNANFSVGNDGLPGRMQMGLFDAPPLPYALTVTAPAAVAGSYPAVEGRLSANNRLAALGPVTGQLALYTDAGSSPVTSRACVGYGGSAPLAGRIALLYRGICPFTDKVKNAQLAGARAVVVVDNVAGGLFVMPGNDTTITIPAVLVSPATGALLAAQLAAGASVQLTLPPAPEAPGLDSSFDTVIPVHEYGHGVSNRLTGGPAQSSCLSNAEQAGEGWSDYLGIMLTTNWATAQLTDGATPRPVGTYILGQPATGGGSRRYPYSTSLSVNPLTYADLAASPEVHNIGEVWCVTLWDMTWGIIQQQQAIEPNLYHSAGTGGNAVALQLVMQGLKLQPCQPGFLDARDAILAADSLLYQGQYHCVIWSAFARRGMGYSARQGRSTSATDQVAAYDLPPAGTLARQPALLAGSSFTISLQATSGCQPGTFTITDDLPAGLQVLSSPGGTLTGSRLSFPVSFTAPGQTRTVSFTAQAVPGAACPLVLPIDDNREASQVGGLASQLLTGSTAWAPSSLRAYSGTTAWRAPDAASASDFGLASAPFTPTGLSTLRFYHAYNLEDGYDGGTVELSTDNGSTWQDAAGYFVEGGYPGAFNAAGAAPGLPCFTGQGAAGAFGRVVLDLRPLAGQAVRLRFRLRTDAANAGSYAGWFVDDIRVANGCGGTQLVSLLGPAGATLGTQSLLTYLLPAAPLATAPPVTSSLQAYPNPFGARGLQLETLAGPQPVVLTLRDVAGRTVLRLRTGPLAPGPVRWPEAGTLPAGLYLLEAQLADGSHRRLHVLRE